MSELTEKDRANVFNVFALTVDGRAEEATLRLAYLPPEVQRSMRETCQRLMRALDEFAPLWRPDTEGEK